MHVQFIPSLNGYQARVGAGGPGQTKSFNVPEHGGQDGARRSAEQWARSNATPHEDRLGVPQANNHSGIAGVCFLWKDTRANGNMWPYLSISIGEARRSRSARLYKSEQAAIRAAVKLRTDAGLPRPTAAQIRIAEERLLEFVLAGPK